MRFDRFRLAAWGLSGLCLAGSTAALMNRHAAFMEAAHRNEHAAADLQQARDESLAVAQRPKEGRFACVTDKPSEGTEFLTDLRRRAHVCGVSIGRWTSHASTYKKDGAPSPDGSDKALASVTKVSCDLQLDGTYPALRAFLTDLWRSERLFTVSSVAWNRTETGSELSMTLGRYTIADPSSAAPAPTDNAKGSQKS